MFKFKLIFIIGVFLLIVFLLLYFTNNIKEKVNEKPLFSFAVLADTQIGFLENSKQESLNFEKAIQVINKQKPSFIVICGDLINSPFNKSQVFEFQRIILRLNKKIPYYLLAGNHDVFSQPTEKSLSFYHENFGKDYYVFSKENIDFFVLNSNLFYSYNQCPEKAKEQFVWLEKQFSKNSNKRRIIFSHHPLFINNFFEENSKYNLPKEIRYSLLFLFKKYNVETVFSGHYHRYIEHNFLNIKLITTIAIGKAFDEVGEGFILVNVFKSRIEIEKIWFAERFCGNYIS